MQRTPDPQRSSFRCMVCSLTVTQGDGVRRTICPHCGNFFHPESQRILHQRPRMRSDVSQSTQEEQEVTLIFVFRMLFLVGKTQIFVFYCMIIANLKENSL